SLSSSNDATHAPNALRSHCARPLLIAHNMPAASRTSPTPPAYPPAQSVPSRSSSSTLTLFPDSSGYRVSVPSFQLARPPRVPIQSVPSCAVNSVRIQLLGSCSVPDGCQGTLCTPSKRIRPDSVPSQR